MTSSQPVWGGHSCPPLLELESYALSGDSNQQPETNAKSKAPSKTAGKGVRPTGLVVVYGLCETVDSLKGP